MNNTTCGRLTTYQIQTFVDISALELIVFILFTPSFLYLLFKFLLPASSLSRSYLFTKRNHNPLFIIYGVALCIMYLAGLVSLLVPMSIESSHVMVQILYYATCPIDDLIIFCAFWKRVTLTSFSFALILALVLLGARLGYSFTYLKGTWNPMQFPGQEALILYCCVVLIYLMLLALLWTYFSIRRSMLSWIMFVLTTNILQAISFTLINFNHSAGLCVSGASFFFYATFLVPFLYFATRVRSPDSEDLPLINAKAHKKKKPPPKDTIDQLNNTQFVPRRDEVALEARLAEIQEHPSVHLVDLKSIQLKESIGIGGYGEIYRGILNGQEVAVKRMFVTESLYVRELQVMSEVKHPNIVRCLGAAVELSGDYILSEYMVRGSVYGLIHNRSFQMTQEFIRHVLRSTALGCSYLHSCNVIHRDLKTQNILISSEWEIKIADFGLSRYMISSMMSRVGTLQWVAPEILREEPYSEKADLWSFGVVIWELQTRKIPYEGHANIGIASGIASGQLRLDFPAGSTEDLVCLAQSCWNRNPRLRPSFQEVLQSMRFNGRYSPTPPTWTSPGSPPPTRTQNSETKNREREMNRDNSPSTSSSYSGGSGSETDKSWKDVTKAGRLWHDDFAP